MGLGLDLWYWRMPSEPSWSIRQDSSVQNSFSSHTSPGFTCRESVMVPAKPLPRGAQDRLAEADPLPVVLLIGVGGHAALGPCPIGST